MPVSLAIVEHFHKINGYFELGLRQEGNQWVGCCPLHGGDNDTAFRIYETGTFFCFTKRCVEQKNHLLALVRLLLNKKNNYTYGYQETVEWLRSNIFENDTVFPDIPKPIRTAFVPYEPKVLFENAADWARFASPIPSAWYIAKGFTEKTVKRFHIGECHDNTHRFYNRVIVPHFNGQGQVIGMTGRTMYPQCRACGLYHAADAMCPTKHSGKGVYAKWLHSPGFRTSQCLYADWQLTTGKVLYLVESVGNVLRLRECGLHNAVAQYGSSLSTGQVYRLKELIRQYNIPQVIIVPDNDGAGISGAKKSAAKIAEFTAARVVVPPVNDVAAMKCDAVRRWLQTRV